MVLVRFVSAERMTVWRRILSITLSMSHPAAPSSQSSSNPSFRRGAFDDRRYQRLLPDDSTHSLVLNKPAFLSNSYLPQSSEKNSLKPFIRNDEACYEITQGIWLTASWPSRPATAHHSLGRVSLPRVSVGMFLAYFAATSFVTFSLIVDDFGMKYKEKADNHNLSHVSVSCMNWK